jgi:hypothetical protein
VVKQRGSDIDVEEKAVGVEREDMIGIEACARMAHGGRVVFFVEAGELAGAAAPGLEIPRTANADAPINGGGPRNKFKKVKSRISEKFPSDGVLRSRHKQSDLGDAFHRKKSLQHMRKDRLAGDDVAQARARANGRTLEVADDDGDDFLRLSLGVGHVALGVSEKG